MSKRESKEIRIFGQYPDIPQDDPGPTKYIFQGFIDAPYLFTNQIITKISQRMLMSVPLPLQNTTITPTYLLL